MRTLKRFYKWARLLGAFRLLILSLAILLVGNAGNNFLRYTDLYKFTRPLWLKQFFIFWDKELFPEKWEMETKRKSW